MPRLMGADFSGISGFCQKRDGRVTGVTTHSERVELPKIDVETGFVAAKRRYWHGT
jgi:hypothetical protein